jgi:hypothetical protein
MKTSYTFNRKTLQIPVIADFVTPQTIEKMQMQDCRNAKCGRDGDGATVVVDCAKCLYDPGHLPEYIRWTRLVSKG